MSSPASQLTAKIVDYLLRIPECFAYRSNTLGIPSSDGSFRPAPKRGVPDITGIYRGRAFYVEVKVSRDRLRNEQKSFALSVRASGGIFITAGDFNAFKVAFCAEFGVTE